MRHDTDFHRRSTRQAYRPSRAWLSLPGEGAVIRTRRPARWRFRGTQLRILLLAALLGWIAWSQLANHRSEPVAAAQAQE
jgi:hypothetical protein